MIEQYSFGNIVVNRVRYTIDMKIVQGEVIPEWWRMRGHSVDVDDIHDILKSGPDIVVLGKGSPGMMKATRTLREFLKDQNIKLIEEKTTKAVEIFNRLLKEGQDIAAGFHLTC